MGGERMMRSFWDWDGSWNCWRHSCEWIRVLRMLILGIGEIMSRARKAFCPRNDVDMYKFCSFGNYFVTGMLSRPSECCQ